MIALSRLVVTRPLVCIAQRNLVSSVLLTRTWENESVAELKRQAKVRGLSPFVCPLLHAQSSSHFF